MPSKSNASTANACCFLPTGHDLFIPASPEPKDHIVEAIGLAYGWREQIIESNLTIKQLAAQRRTSESRVHKYLPLLNLGPEILKHALKGTLPPSITLANLLQAARQLDWQAQRVYLNLEKSNHCC